VNSILVSKTYFQVAQHPVGLESRLQDVKSLLGMEKNIDTTRMVGIYGTSGIGKTTIAKAIYNSIASQFEGSCFLENIREVCSQKNGVIHLQEKLLSKILGSSSGVMIDDVGQGITLIKQKLHSLRVLIVLDDVNRSVQLEKLAGEDDWFGLGSKIIITTKDKHLLRVHGVDLTYQVNELDHNEALQLFRWNALKSDKPIENFEERTERAIIRYAGGLPLALIVMGSNLFGKKLLEWESALDRYKKLRSKNIHNILKVNYDGLKDTEKKIFLDIACSFKGQNVGNVTKGVDKYGLSVNDSIKVLVDKSLISIDKFDTIIMHELLQEMGRNISRWDAPKEPPKEEPPNDDALGFVFLCLVLFFIYYFSISG
jgi:energy-coupling factor transporter ATP-binding protein EcfA2